MFTQGDLVTMHSIIDGIEGKGPDRASVCLNGRRSAKETVADRNFYITYLRGCVPMSAPGYESRDIFLTKAYAERGCAYTELQEWKQDVADRTEVLRITERIHASHRPHICAARVGGWKTSIRATRKAYA